MPMKPNSMKNFSYKSKEKTLKTIHFVFSWLRYRFKSKMIRFKVILFLILLPILTKSKNVHTQRQSSYEDDDNAQSPLMDQFAQATTWKSPNRVVSATYSGDPHTGRVDHANLVINVVPRPSAKPVDVDLYASQTLANAKTAEEYVNKALDMKQKYEHSTPSSSFVKYDIYDSEKTKLMPIHTQENQHELNQQEAEGLTPKEDIADMTKSASEYSEYIQHPAEYVAQTTTTTTYKHPEYSTNFKDLDPSNSDYNQHYMNNYDTFDSIRNINYDHNSYNSALRKLAGYPSKEEMIKYIERAVKKYLREMTLNGKLSSSLNSAPSAHAEVKTYYRFPSSTTVSPPIESTKMYSAGTHSEFFKPTKHSYKHSYVKPLTVDTYAPEGVDLTVRSKKRPKPIDLSALDVGQSWSHSSTLNNPEPIIPYRKPKKHKIHINTQTYHDINALPYVPNRGLLHEDYNPYSTATAYIDHSSGHHHSSYKDHPVGASISFGGHAHNTHHGSYGNSDEPTHKAQFTPSMQVVNGIPVKNPYKFNMDTLNDIFDNSGERTKYSLHDNDYGSSTAAIWNPYNLDLSSLSSHDNTGTGSSYSYDVYNPKYNNNPEEQYYAENNYQLSDWENEYSTNRQRGTIGSDMHSSSSTSNTSTRSKKVAAPQNGTSKRAVTKLKPKSKSRTSKRSQSQQNRELERDLTPPPAKQK